MTRTIRKHEIEMIGTIVDLQILHLEDDLRDADVVRAMLEAEGIDCRVTRVDNEADFLAALENSDFNLILADYTLPDFDGLSALKITRQKHPDIPFIFVSGTLDEEVAIEALKIGATDYVFKTRLSRIVPSVHRAISEATDKSDRKRAEEALRQSEERFRTMADTLPEVIWITALDPEKIFYLSPSFERIWGRSREELIGNPGLWMETMHPEDRDRIVKIFRDWVAGGNAGYYDVEYRITQPGGATRWIHERAVLCLDEEGKPYRVNGISADITDRKRAEADLQQALDEIGKLKDQLYKENIVLREEIDKASMFEEIVGESPALQAVLNRVAKVALTDSTVLITGETGTGKELIARAIHKRSQRSERAFVTVNCSAVPSSLIASELFGHEKGAFTGATQRRLGRFELAEGGTIFLDEIGELPLETQIALLRVLQEREFERVGGTKAIRADVRVITATNRDLQGAIKAGIFRDDLYYRLNVFPIEMPPLRNRREDIPLLVEYFIDRYASKAGKKIRGITRKTLDGLTSYSWPGNIRELQNVIERSIIVCETENLTIDESWLSLSDPAEEPAWLQPSRPFAKMTSAQEKETIEAILAETGGRVSGPSGAAAKLGLPSSTLESKIKALKINKYRFHENH